MGNTGGFGRIYMATAFIESPEGILMLRRRPTSNFAGLWQPPEGKLEPNESAYAALERELAEEIQGKVIRAVRIGRVSTAGAIGASPVLATRDLFEVALSEGPITLSEEHDQSRWVDPFQLPPPGELLPGVVDAVAAYLEYRARQNRSHGLA